MVVNVYTLGVFALGVSLVFLNFDDICMCVMNKQFELLEFVFYSVYVDLQYDGISLSFTAGSEGVVAMSAECEYMGGTRGSGVVSSAYGVLEMSVVRGVRGVGCRWNV